MRFATLHENFKRWSLPKSLSVTDAKRVFRRILAHPVLAHPRIMRARTWAQATWAQVDPALDWLRTKIDWERNTARIDRATLPARIRLAEAFDRFDFEQFATRRNASIALWCMVTLSLLASISAFLPQNIRVTRTTYIQAPRDVVFDHVNSLAHVANSAQSTTAGSDTMVSVMGPHEGVGRTVMWSSAQRGMAQHTVVESVKNSFVVTAFESELSGTSKATYLLQPDTTGTVVTLKMETPNGTNPISRWIGVLTDQGIGDQSEINLHNLKSVAERR